MQKEANVVLFDMLILLVEDDRALAATTIDFLHHEGIEVDYADSIAHAKLIADGQQYDAFVLDVGLPDGVGFELARYFQRSHPAVPILFLTANSLLDAKLEAFSLGALDYLTKPFELAELAIRIKLLGVKRQDSLHHVFRLGDLVVDQAKRIIRRGERVITLSPQQWTLLTLLIEHTPNPVSKTRILERVWPEQDASITMYKTLITRLRSNLSQEHEKPLLHTLKGVGVVLRD